MTRRTLLAGVAVATVLLAGGSTTATATAVPPRMVMAQAEDRLPSLTATDWVTHADHVVVVDAVSEQLTRPTATELERGEGLLGRTVRLQVAQVVWSRDGAPQPAPRSWDYRAAGAVFTDGKPDEPVPMALQDRPRVEPGHRYIMAITWEGPHCSAGDDPEPARWMGLGEGSLLPYDGDVIGQGEHEGRQQTVSQARVLAAGPDVGPDVGLEEQLAGGTVAALAAELASAAPARKPAARAMTASC